MLVSKRFNSIDAGFSWGREAERESVCVCERERGQKRKRKRGKRARERERKRGRNNTLTKLICSPCSRDNLICSHVIAQDKNARQVMNTMTHAAQKWIVFILILPICHLFRQGEVQVLDYVNQQYRLLPLVAMAHAFMLTGSWMNRLYRQSSPDNPEELQEVRGIVEKQEKRF